MTGIRKGTRGKQSSLVKTVQQLSFEFDELDDQTDYRPEIRRRGDDTTPIRVVDAFLAKMLKEPEKFADGLRRIGAKYGSVLLPRDRVAAIQEKVRELQEVAAGLGG